MRDGRFKGFHFLLAEDWIMFECSLESASPPQGEVEICPKAAQGPQAGLYPHSLVISCHPSKLPGSPTFRRPQEAQLAACGDGARVHQCHQPSLC